MKKQIRLRVNGLDHDVMIKPHQTLLDALRDELGLIGTKKGCDNGECAPRVSEGEPCDPVDNPTRGPPCDEGLSCSDDGVCVRRVTSNYDDLCRMN